MYVTDTTLGQQTIVSFNSAFSRQTYINKQRQAEYYIRFGLEYGIDLLYPSISEVCMFIQYLANSLTSNAARGNYKSGAKWWIEMRGGDISPFASIQVKTVEKGAANLNTHIPNPAPAITPFELNIICQHLSTVKDGVAIKAAMLVGFFGFLRASNVISPSASTWGGPHTITRADLLSHENGLVLVLKSTKTRGAYEAPAVLALPRITGSILCPTQAWAEYCVAVPGLPYEPAFKTSAGAHLTPAPIVKEMRAAVHAAQCPFSGTVSMHSLRRGGAQTAQKAGAERLDIAAHGTWASKSGLNAYVPNDSSTRVAKALASLFGI